MKQIFFEKFSDNEIRTIRMLLIESYDVINVKLPEDIKVFLNRENNQIGNLFTRINRCLSLIDRECVRRFLNQK